MRDARSRALFSCPRPLIRAAFAFALLAVASPTIADDAPTFADASDEEVGDTNRTWGLLLDPLAMVIGVYGGEADVVLARFAALAVEGDLYRRGDAAGLAIGTGLLVFPLGSVLHKLYLEPRIAYARPLSRPIAAFAWDMDVVGLGATAGWQWTWDYGFSLRLGGGAMYYLGGPRSASASAALALGAQPVLDGSFGWMF
jgi:hypothetical protein